MALIETCAASAIGPKRELSVALRNDQWRPIGAVANDVLRQLVCEKSGRVASVASKSNQQNSEAVRASNELAGARSVMELALNRDIASHGFA